MIRQNLNHTGLSPYNTSTNPGMLKWSFTTGHYVWSFPSIGSDGTIYVGSCDNKLYAINPDGTEKWSFTTGKSIDSCPAIASDGTIYLSSDDHNLYAINPDGSEKWRFPTLNEVISSPAIGIDGTIYAGSRDRNLYAINPDGTEKWSFPTLNQVVSSPAIASDGTIYVGSYDYRMYAINPDGTEKWNFATGDRVDSSPAIGSDGTIYVGSWDNKLYAINSDGTEKWNFTTGSRLHSSPAIGSDGTIYVGSVDNNLYAINPDGTEKWSFMTGDFIYQASPAISSDGTIYIGSRDKNLYAINPDGTKKWNFTTGSYVDSSPAIGSDGTIYIGSCDNNLYAIGIPSKPPIADAGRDQTVNEGDVVLLNGSGSVGGELTGITPPLNLVSWWPGDGNASDIADGNHGTLISGTTFEAGKVNQAFSFDGINDRVGVTDSDNLKITASLTIDVWVYIKSFPAPSPNYGQIIFRGDDRGGLDPYYLATTSDHTIRFHVESLSGREDLEAPIPEDQFVFVAATLDNATGLMRIYINDTVAAETTTGIRPFRDLNPLFNPGIGIGNHAPSSIFNQPFHGLIDELEIFNRALAASELRAIFNSGIAGKYKGWSVETKIVSYEWDFESDGIYDYQETIKNAPDGAFDGKTTCIYGDNGMYIVTLRITDETGANDTDTCNVTVNNLPPTVDPIGSFMVEFGFPLTINANASDPGSDDLTFIWNWGDGTSDTITIYYNDGIGADPYPSPFGIYPFPATDQVQHVYGNDGVYTIILTVEDDDGGITVYMTNVTVITVAPPTLYINTSQDREDVILYWDMPSILGVDHYLIYRSTSQTDFDFNTVWVNTSSDNETGEPAPIPLRTMWNDTKAAFPGNDTNYEEQYYYTVRAVNILGQMSSTSRTVGKWTKTFPKGVSTFSLPLEPLQNITIDYCLNDMNTRYIKWVHPISHRWMKHGDGVVNDTKMKLGEGYEVRFDTQTNYTFTGLPGAMISYDDDSGFLGFDHATEAKNLTVMVESNGDVNLTWQEPGSMGDGWYGVYYSNKRDGFFGTFNVSYFHVCPSVNFGNNTVTHINALANESGARLYYMVVPYNASCVRGASTYSIGIWTEEYTQGYDTFGIPLKLETNQPADWYCDNIPDTVGINYYIHSEQWWSWHSTRMPAGAFDPVLEMTVGYQISTSSATKFIFIGV
jgi:outer membrane protein assembly factor BamB